MSKETFEKHSFSIGDPSKLLEILRSKMYSDPIGSICREIACNARDAHREAGIPNTPIKIFLPEENHPYLRIKDFGPGISPERMKDVYLKYTETTKGGTNQTGGFGLGAKTPFSYTNAFTIVTCIDGIKYHYIAYIDETDIGALFLLDKNNTKEQNGTEIVIHVQTRDKDVFKEKLKESVAYWDVKPEFILGSKTLDYSYDEYTGTEIFSKDNWKVVKNSYSYKSDVSVIIDGICYKLSNKNIDLSSLNGVKQSVVITINSGDISLSSTRENIYYNNKTIDFLTNLCEDVYNDIYKHVISEINNSKSLLEAILVYIKLNKDFNFLNNNIKYDDVNLYKVINGIYNNFYTKGYACNSDKTLTSLKYYKLFDNPYSHNNNVIVVINDNSEAKIFKRHAKKVAEHFKYNCKNVVILTKKPFVKDSIDIEKVFPYKLSDFCVLKNNSQKKTKTILFKRSGNDLFSRTSKSKILDDTSTKAIIQVEKCSWNNSTIAKNSKYSNCFYEFEKMLNVKIYGYKNDLDEESLQSIFGENYLTIDDLIEEAESIITKEKVVHYYYCREQQRILNNNIYFKYLHLYKSIDNYEKSLFKVLELYNSAFIASISAFSYPKLSCELFPQLNVSEELLNYKPKNNFGDIDKISNLIDKKYPMLKLLDFLNYNNFNKNECENKKIITDYINNINLQLSK